MWISTALKKAADKTVLKGGLKKMKKLFRKATAILANTALIGMTVGMAAAASYPEPFTSNTAIVVGANAAPSDNIAAASLASNLDANAASGGAVTVTGGESFYLGKSSDEFQFGMNLGSVYSDLDDNEMESFLADGDFDDGTIDSEFSQKITLGTATSLGFFADTDYDDDKTPTIGFHFDDAEVLSYEMTLDDGDELFSELEGTDLPLMGREYYVLDSTTDFTELVLLDSAEKTMITEGETVTIGDKTITIEYIDADSAKFNVNGEITDKLSDDGANGDKYYELSDDSYLVLSENLYASKDTGISKAEISIGKGKITLSTSGAEVELNDDTVTGLTSFVYETGTDVIDETGDVVQSIKLTWTTDDEVFLIEGGAITMPGFETIKVLFSDMDFPSDTEKITIDNGETATLNMENFDIDLIYSANTGDGSTVTQGDDGNLLHIDATAAESKVYFLKDNDRFLATDLDDTLSEVEQLYYEVTLLRNDSNGYDLTLDDLTDGNDDITFTNEDADEIDTSRGNVEVTLNTVYEDGVTVSVADAVLIKAAGLDTALLVDNTDNVSLVEIAKVNVTQSDGEDLQFDVVVSDKGMIIEIPAAATLAGDNDLLIFYEAADDGDLDYLLASPDFYADLAWDTDEDYAYAQKNGTDITFKEESDNVWAGYVESDLTSKVTYDTDSETYEVTYFGEEVVATVSIASSDAVVTASGDAGVMTVKDSEVASVAGKNLVVVGGSAINSVAAELLGGAYSEATFTSATGVGAGEFLIQSFARSGKTALLVAGYNAADTEKAVTYLLNNDVDTTVDVKMKGTSATEATVVTA
jgi:hypothetical protein